MSKHTPGPWIVQPNDETDMFVPIIAGNLGGLVGGAMLWPSEIDAKDFSRAERNAHLIAAAPELLEALERADALIENLWKAVPWGQTHGLDIMALNEVPSAMKRAIAKARGEA